MAVAPLGVDDTAPQCGEAISPLSLPHGGFMRAFMRPWRARVLVAVPALAVLGLAGHPRRPRGAPRTTPPAPPPAPPRPPGGAPPPAPPPPAPPPPPQRA